MLWDRLQQDSPVYEGDTIRTAEQSEATLNFIDGNIMDLQSNTMIRISLSEDGGTEVDFSSGSISVRTAESSSMKIRSGSSVVDIAAGATVAAAGSGDESGSLKVAVKDGNASLTGENGTVSLEAGKVTEISSEGTIEDHFLSVNYPEDNYRTMTFTSSICAVDFGWDSTGRAVLLETSDNKNFDTVTSSETFEDARTTQLMFSEGAHWWRMTTIPENEGEEPETVSGKLTVIYSPAPTPISPRMGYNTTFRKKLPQIRLSWSESERATAYRLDIADNTAMQNPVISQRVTTTSALITTLEEGTWYWTVTPYYTFNDIGYTEPSARSFFSITKNDELKAPVLQTPDTNGIVCTQVPLDDGTINYKTVLFSWKNDPEAASYDLTVWRENSSSPIIQKTIYNNYCSIDTSQDAIPNGNISWQVTIHDSEGNTNTSEVHQFYAIDADIEQKTLYPPEKYRVATTHSAEIMFKWKTNVPYDATLQIAKDSNFSNIVYSAVTSDSTAAGKQLTAGTYYWRITTKAGSTAISTQPKTLIVEPLLNQAQLFSPAEGSKLVILPDAEHALTWKTVEDADYYQFRLFNKTKPDSYIIERNSVESENGTDCSIPIDIAELGAGNYGWTVQAFRNETTSASRSSSTVAEYAFTIRELHPVTMSNPQNKKEYTGLDAWLNPSRFTWTVNDVPASTTLTLYKGSVAARNVIRTYRNPKSGLQMPQLEAGTYWWTLTAKTAEGYDISAAEPHSFTVAPIPPLATPELIVPEDGTVFGVDYLRQNRTLSFDWNPVADATEYIFTITTSSGRQIENLTLPPEQTEFQIEDLTVLESGPIIWTVKARRFYNGLLLQESETASAEFIIDLPMLSAPAARDFGIRYGM